MRKKRGVLQLFSCLKFHIWPPFQPLPSAAQIEYMHSSNFHSDLGSVCVRVFLEGLWPAFSVLYARAQQKRLPNRQFEIT